MAENFEVIEELPRKEYPEGHILIEEGSAPGAIYFLIEGTVEVSKGGTAITRVKDKGAVFGEMSILLDVPPTATVKTLTPASFHIAPDPRRLLETHPRMATYVATILAQRLDALNKYLVDLKGQFNELGGHGSMVDEVIETLMTKHPRKIARRPDSGA